MAPKAAKTCTHKHLFVESTPAAGAQDITFERPSLEKCQAATTTSGRATARLFTTPEDVMSDGSTFPAPLVLPDDALAFGPDEPAQSLKSWLTYKKDRPITQGKKKIYVIPPPGITKEVAELMKDWETPNVPVPKYISGVRGPISAPHIGDLCLYVRAFYHKMDVVIHDPFLWQPWDSAPSKADKGLIGLATPAPAEELVGIRYRPSPDGVARKQLNLDDILDALLNRVPKDAYAIVMMVDHDLYEDEDDDFCCGRAYGGSKIAIVSSFRYNPVLDDYSDIDHEHMWPASHCKTYLENLCPDAERPGKRAKKAEPKAIVSSSASPLRAAIEASRKSLKPKSAADLAGLWFSRTARTLSHELGHCFGFGHCVYYACVMQGTASVAEDVRQPPYLCPVCLSKLSNGSCSLMGGGMTLDLQKAYIKERYEALSVYRKNWPRVGMFAGWGAWIDKRLEQIEGGGPED